MRSCLAAFAIALLLAAAGCATDTDSGDDATPSATPTEEPLTTGPVEISLGEWAVIAEPDEVAAGEITFEISNGGTDPHEFVVVSTDEGPEDLPTKDDGSVDEDEVEIVDEVEEIPAPSGDAVVSEELTVDLEPGGYALICNLVEEEDGETEVHYKLGMRTAFTVS